jgi:hypothetical protein
MLFAPRFPEWGDGHQKINVGSTRAAAVFLES